MRTAFLLFSAIFGLAACDSETSGPDPTDAVFINTERLRGMWEEREDSGLPEYLHFERGGEDQPDVALRVRVWENRDGGCYELDEDYGVAFGEITATEFAGPSGGSVSYTVGDEALTLTGISGGGGSDRYRPSSLSPSEIGPLCP